MGAPFQGVSQELASSIHLPVHSTGGKHFIFVILQCLDLFRALNKGVSTGSHSRFLSAAFIITIPNPS